MTEFFNAHSFIIAQCFGFAAMAVAIISYQFRKHRTILLMSVLSTSIWCCHFLMLGLITPFVLNCIGVIRAIIFSFDRKWVRSKTVLTVFLVVLVILSIVSWENAWSLLPGIASIFSTVSMWQKNPQRLRILTIPVCVCWFTYDFANNSWAGSCNEIFVFTSIIIALIRYSKIKKQKQINSVA